MTTLTPMEACVNGATEILSGWDERRGNYRQPHFDRHRYTALLIDQCLDWFDTVRGPLSPDERRALHSHIGHHCHAYEPLDK